MIEKKNLKKINDYLWEIPKEFRHDMRVPARIYATEKMLEEIGRDQSLEQLVNVATLPGIQKYAIVMPDAHEGYGFPIGGVAAMKYPDGVISPGGIGYDINCGVRLLRSEKSFKELDGYWDKLARELFQEIPSGVGRSGQLKLNDKEFDLVLKDGVKQMIEMGYGDPDDPNQIESNGALENADPAMVSDHAKDRGRDQLGTMGAGNHFVEVDRVEEIFDENDAKKLGLFKNQVVILIHTGSRGLGHQVATDYIRKMMQVMPKYGINLPDRELACVPFSSPEGTAYFNAMAAAANFAWSNRQMITWEVRRVWKNVLDGPETSSGRSDLQIVYDVAHNIAKIEEYPSAGSGQVQKLIIHRKGATRAFPDQPVLIPGSMGTASYVLVGTEGSLEQSFGSSCHGAGRRMSRHAAKKIIRGSTLKEELKREGVHIAAGSMSGLAEEAPVAYKDVDEVVEVVHRAGIAKKVAKLKPVVVVKG